MRECSSFVQLAALKKIQMYQNYCSDFRFDFFSATSEIIFVISLVARTLDFRMAAAWYYVTKHA